MSQTKNGAVDWWKSANTKLERADYQGAIADYTEAIKLKPDDASAYIGRGGAKGFLADYKGAIADFTEEI